MYLCMYVCMYVCMHAVWPENKASCRVGSETTNHVALRLYVCMYVSNATGMQLLQTYFLWARHCLHVL